MIKSIIRNHRLHNKINDNGLGLIDLEFGNGLVIKSTLFP